MDRRSAGSGTIRGYFSVNVQYGLGKKINFLIPGGAVNAYRGTARRSGKACPSRAPLLLWRDGIQGAAG
jgi:hypothetical protein